MERFHVIQDAAAIVVTKSVFKQVPVYRRGRAIYIGARGGYVRISKGGLTDVADIRWDGLEIPGLSEKELIVASGTVGKLQLPEGYSE